jgi:hypothetical protein
MKKTLRPFWPQGFGFSVVRRKPSAALSNNNDNYYAHKGEYFVNYRISNQGKHLPTINFASGFYLIHTDIQIYAVVERLSTIATSYHGGVRIGERPT